MDINTHTIQGRLAEDPTIYYRDGQRGAVARLRVVTSASYLDESGEEKSALTYHTVILRHELVEHAEGFRKNDGIFVTGAPRDHVYVDDKQIRRVQRQIEATTVSMPLRVAPLPGIKGNPARVAQRGNAHPAAAPERTTQPPNGATPRGQVDRRSEAPNASVARSQHDRRPLPARDDTGRQGVENRMAPRSDAGMRPEGPSRANAIPPSAVGPSESEDEFADLDAQISGGHYGGANH